MVLHSVDGHAKVTWTWAAGLFLRIGGSKGGHDLANGGKSWRRGALRPRRGVRRVARAGSVRTVCGRSAGGGHGVDATYSCGSSLMMARRWMGDGAVMAVELEEERLCDSWPMTSMGEMRRV